MSQDERDSRGDAPRASGPLRAINAVVSVAMLGLFVVHGVGNAFQMMGVGTPLSKAISYALVACVVVHLLIGVVLTADTLRAQRLAGVAYPARNKRFWAVRLSGFAVALLIVTHVLQFWRSDGGVVRLAPFLGPQLVVSILMVVAIAVHVLANVEPLMVSLGVGRPRERARDLLLVFAVALLLMAAGFVVYYLRWSVI